MHALSVLNDVLNGYLTLFTLLVGDPNAVNDIINNPMFAGSLESLAKVIQVCDSIFGFIVSFCAFFIISSAMLRNVVAGMYASNTKLFDKVNEVKNSWVTTADGKVRSASNVGIRGVGTVGVFLLRLLPDPKELSEFKDDTIEPRDYFLKAIPQMIGVVMIGVVIYNGYYKDLLGRAATLGSYVIEKFILDIDPVEGLNKLLGWASQPDMASKEDSSVGGQLVYDISYDMYHQIVTFYPDQTTDAAKNKIATTVEDWVRGQVSANCNAYLDDTKWKSSMKVNRVLNSPNLTGIEKTSDTQVVKVWAMPISSLGLETGKHAGEDWYLRVIVVFDRIYESKSSTGVVTDGTLQIPNSSLSLVNSTANGTRTKIVMSTDKLAYFGVSVGAKADGSANITKEADGIYISGDVRSKITSGSLNVSGIFYKTSDNSATITAFSKSDGSTFKIYSPTKGSVEVGQSYNLTTSATDKK